MSHTPRVPARAELSEILASPRVAQALAHCILAAGFLAPLLRRLIGWPGLVAIMATLVVIAVAVLIARRRYLDWHGLLPLSIITFVVWSGITVFFTDYEWITVQASLYQIGFAFLGLTVALTRDMIQVVRAVGGVLRVLLTASVLLEVLSGIVLDTPFRLIGMAGSIAGGGPIQGVFGTRNLLGMVTLIALVTFVIEWRTKSVTRGVSIFSVSVAAICIVFSQSPVTVIVMVVLALATISLYGLRQATPETRPVLQAGLLALAVGALIVAWVSRTAILATLNAGSEFEVRYQNWVSMWRFIQLRPLEGWGWAGLWNDSVVPFSIINLATGRDGSSGLNAYLDVYLQVGLVGLVAFLVLCAFAFIRSWLLASNRRSVVYAWPALVLVAVLITGAAESFPLVEAGWLVLVICAVKASEGLSWRSRLPHKKR